MIPEFSQKFDGVINIITAIAVIFYASYMSLSENNNGLRKRLQLLFVLLSSFCLIRGINYIFDLSPGVNKLVLMISSVIPLSLFLLIELLLRRHLPLCLKLFISFSTFILVVSIGVFGINNYVLYSLMANYIVTLLSFVAVFFLKKDLELESGEIGLLQLVILISIWVIPLVVTDFKQLLGWDTIRLGALGILFFLYSLVKIWDYSSAKKGITQLFSLLVFNLVSAVIFSYLFGLFDYYFHVFIIFIMLRMFADIVIYARDSYLKKAQDIGMRVMDLYLRGNLKLDEVKKNVENENFHLLTNDDLIHYNAKRFLTIFKKSGLYFKNDIKSLAASIDIKEEVEHLFEDFDCNACIFIKIVSLHSQDEDKFHLVLFKWPDLAPKNKIEREVMLMQHLASQVTG